MDKIKPYFPILTWGPAYQKEYIIRDLIAGFTVALTVVPQVSVLHTFLFRQIFALCLLDCHTVTALWLHHSALS